MTSDLFVKSDKKKLAKDLHYHEKCCIFAKIFPFYQGRLYVEGL